MKSWSIKTSLQYVVCTIVKSCLCQWFVIMQIHETYEKVKLFVVCNDRFQHGYADSHLHSRAPQQSKSSQSWLSLVLSFFNPCSLNDLGLETFSLAMLFTRIFIPTSFLLVCVLHLHYFHDRFLALTDLQAVVAKEESTIYRWGHQPASALMHLYIWITSKPGNCEPSQGGPTVVLINEHFNLGTGGNCPPSVVTLCSTVGCVCASHCSHVVKCNISLLHPLSK